LGVFLVIVHFLLLLFMRNVDAFTMNFMYFIMSQLDGLVGMLASCQGIVEIFLGYFVRFGGVSIRPNKRVTRIEYGS